jgi:hypothetical protein
MDAQARDEDGCGAHFPLIRCVAKQFPELDDAIVHDEGDDDKDDTYIDIGVVAPVVVESLEDNLFV